MTGTSAEVLVFASAGRERPAALRRCGRAASFAFVIAGSDANCVGPTTSTAARQPQWSCPWDRSP